MNRLLYGPPHPCEIDMDVREEECPHCKGWGGFYLNDEGDEISRDEYLAHKGEEGYELLPCEECEGKGFIEVWHEEEEEPDIWDVLK